MKTRVYFASNRDVIHESSKSGDVFGDRFNANGPQCFRVGQADLRLKGRDPKDDDAWSVGQTRLYPETLEDGKPRDPKLKLGSASLFEDLRVTLKAEPLDVIVYLHGFANDFQNAAIRAGQLQALYGGGAQKAIVVMFSWPSNGEVQPAWNYFSDREDAEASGLAMGRALKRLADFLAEMRAADREAVLAARRAGGAPDPNDLVQCTRRLHLVAHSMGNWALRHAIRKFVELNGAKAPRIFDNAFLMAADEDHDALTAPEKLQPLTGLASKVFVYHAANDVALTISDKTKGLPDRLGADGPTNLDLADERVYAIDCGRVSKTTLFHGRHQYYRLRDEAIEDVRLTLSGAPQEGRPGRVTVREGRSWRLEPAPGAKLAETAPREPERIDR